MPPSPRKKRSLVRSLLRMLWVQPLVAIPFGVFFGILSGAEPGTFLVAYQLSLVFSFTIATTIILTEHLLMPRLRMPTQGTRAVWMVGMVYGIASVAGSCFAGLIVNTLVMPGFFGGVRSVMVFAMFTLLFCGLFLAVSYALSFFRDAVERAKSDQELTLARRIQRSFLLSSFPAMPRLEVHAINISSKQVSGDFYDVVPAGDDAFLLAIADVAGKGVPAALLSSMLQASLRTQADTIHSVAQILRNINQLVCRSSSNGQFATFFLARVEEKTLRLSYTNAGHNFPLVFRGSSQTPLELGGTVVGILESAEYEEGTIQLEAGDRVVFYTDGISEASRDGMELFGEERLVQLITDLAPGLSARDMTERILAGVREYLDGVEAGDDMTVMVLRVLDPVGAAVRPIPAGPSLVLPTSA